MEAINKKTKQTCRYIEMPAANIVRYQYQNDIIRTWLGIADFFDHFTI